MQEEIQQHNSGNKGSFVSVQSKIARLQEKFKKICLLYGQPLSYCSAYLAYLNNKQYESKEQQYKLKVYFLTDEINLIKKGQSASQNIALLLGERQKVLKHLRSDLIMTRNSKQINLSDCVQKLKTIRMYNLSIIESMSNLSKHLKFQQNTYFSQIIDKISRDLDFLRFSYLRRYIQFSSNHDPLFIIPLKKFQNLQATTGYSRRPIINLFSIDLKYRRRLEIADNYTKLITNLMQKNQAQDVLDILETQNQKYIRANSPPPKKNQKLSSNQNQANQTINKYNLPTINKRNSMYSSNLKQQTQKMIVSNIVKQIIQDYAFQQRQNKQQPKINRNAYKKRVNTQAINRSSVYQTLDPSSTLQRNNFVISQKRSETVGKQTDMPNKDRIKPIQLIYKKKFQQDQGDYYPIQKSLRNSLQLNGQRRHIFNKQIKKIKDKNPTENDSQYQNISNQTQEKQQISIINKKQRSKAQEKPVRQGKSLNYQRQKEHKQYASQPKKDQPPSNESSAEPGKIKYKVNRIRYRESITVDQPEATTTKPHQSLKQTIYKQTERNYYKRFKNYRQLNGQNEQNKEKEKEKNLQSLIGNNNKLLNKIRKIQKFSSKNQRRNQIQQQQQLYEDQVIEQSADNNNRYKSPLDKVLALRQYLDYDSQLQNKKGVRKGRRQFVKDNHKGALIVQDIDNKIQDKEQVQRQKNILTTKTEQKQQLIQQRQIKINKTNENKQAQKINQMDNLDSQKLKSKIYYETGQVKNRIIGQYKIKVLQSNLEQQKQKIQQFGKNKEQSRIRNLEYSKSQQRKKRQVINNLIYKYKDINISKGQEKIEMVQKEKVSDKSQIQKNENKQQNQRQSNKQVRYSFQGQSKYIKEQKKKEIIENKYTNSYNNLPRYEDSKPQSPHQPQSKTNAVNHDIQSTNISLPNNTNTVSQPQSQPQSKTNAVNHDIQNTNISLPNNTNTVSQPQSQPQSKTNAVNHDIQNTNISLPNNTNTVSQPQSQPQSKTNAVNHDIENTNISLPNNTNTVSQPQSQPQSKTNAVNHDIQNTNISLPNNTNTVSQPQSQPQSKTNAVNHDIENTNISLPNNTNTVSQPQSQPQSKTNAVNHDIQNTNISLPNNTNTVSQPQSQPQSKTNAVNHDIENTNISLPNNTNTVSQPQSQPQSKTNAVNHDIQNTNISLPNNTNTVSQPQSQPQSKTNAVNHDIQNTNISLPNNTNTVSQPQSQPQSKTNAVNHDIENTNISLPNNTNTVSQPQSQPQSKTNAVNHDIQNTNISLPNNTNTVSQPQSQPQSKTNAVNHDIQNTNISLPNNTNTVSQPQSQPQSKTNAVNHDIENTNISLPNNTNTVSQPQSQPQSKTNAVNHDIENTNISLPNNTNTVSQPQSQPQSKTNAVNHDIQNTNISLPNNTNTVSQPQSQPQSKTNSVNHDIQNTNISLPNNTNTVSQPQSQPQSKTNSVIINPSIKPQLNLNNQQSVSKDNNGTTVALSMTKNSNINSTLVNNQLPNKQYEKIQRKNTNLNLKNSQLTSEQQIQNEKKQKQSILILQKCTFLSKSIKQQDLLKQIKHYSKQSYELLKVYLFDNYFRQRHLQLINCLFDKQVACYCLYYPLITQSQRLIIIVHFQVVKQQFNRLLKQILNTFVKYFFTNDPAQKIIFLKPASLPNENISIIIKTIKGYSEQIQSPIMNVMLQKTAYLITRKDIICNKNQQFTSILTTIALFVNSQQNISTQQLKNKRVSISSQCLKRMNAKIKGKQGKRFLNSSQLQQYLKDQSLPLIKSQLINDIFFTSSLWQDCLVNTKFYVHSKYFYFTVQPPFTYLYQSKDVYYLLLSTYDKKKYFLLADKLYEDDSEIDILANFKQNVLNKKFDDVFLSQKFNNKIISCPQFKKRVQTKISSQSSALIQFQLNWAQYIKGVRFYKQDLIHSQLLCPFLCAFIYIDENGVIKYQYSAIIQQNDTIK